MTSNLDGTPIAQPSRARFNLKLATARRPQQYRCNSCGRLLGRFVMVPGLYMAIQCPKCKRMNVEDIALNSTTAPVLMDMLERANGSAPEGVRAALK